jgi:MSHA pilin protein MshB
LKETLNKDVNNGFADPGASTSIGNSFTYQPADSSVVVYINNN